MAKPSWKPRHPMLLVKKFTAGLLSASLLVSLFIALGGAHTPAAAAGPSAPGTVSGTVFQNFNSEGWKVPGGPGVPASIPIAGVTVTAFDAQGDTVGSAVSGSDGRYMLTTSAAFSKDLRVEFSDWDAKYEPAFAAQGSAPAGALGNDTSVQFVTLNNANNAQSIDFALVIPNDVIQPNAPVATSVQSAGGLTYNSTDRPALVAQPWLTEWEKTPGKNSPVTKLAEFGELGSTWGVAYSRPANDLYTAATLKRMADLGDFGLGGVYRTEDVLANDGTLNASAVTDGWFELDDLEVVNVSGTPKIDIGASLVPNSATRNLKNSNDPRPEVEAFALAGRVGIGALETSVDGTRLFASNLHDGQVYGVDIADSASTPSIAYQVSTPVGENQVIWAVKQHEGRLYIGYVDTGVNPATGVVNPGKSAAELGMKAYVASTPIEVIMDPQAVAPVWTTELSIDLGYTKGSNLEKWLTTWSPAGYPRTVEDFYPQVTRWNSWTDTWNWAGGSVGIPGSGKKDGGYKDIHAYPQAILSSIAFDSDGYMNLGFTDRTGPQSGNRNFPAIPNPANGDLWVSIANGDVLAAAPSSVWTMSAGAGCPTVPTGERFILECGGKVGSRVVRTTITTNANPPKGQKPTYNNNEGPGSGEFFNDRKRTGLGDNHNEVGLGSVATYPGLPDVYTTATDPRSNNFTAGLMWFDQRTGAATRGLELTDNPSGAGSVSFQKGGGLGGTALLAQLAPVEIGNRVWLDADLNGRQDADEPAINGAKVELWTTDAQGEPEFKVAERITSTIDGQSGTYYFRSDDSDTVASPTQPHPLVAGGSYVLVFERGAGEVDLVGPNAEHAGFAGLSWSDLQRTKAQAQTPGTTPSNDSNPDVSTGRYFVTVGSQGQNNHTYDSGWYGTNGYKVLKEFDFNGGLPELPTGATYTFDVVSAHNFRGEDRLNSAGAGGAGDPQINEIEFTLTDAASWKWESTEDLPLGYELGLSERGIATGGVTWSNPDPTDSSKGRVLIVPRNDTQLRAEITATNHLGMFEVSKSITGEAKDQVSADVKFKISYTLDGGAEQEAWVSAAEPFKLGLLPVGTAVTIREVSPIETSPVVTGIHWGTPTISSTSPGLAGPTDGWYSFSITKANPNIALQLLNTAEEDFTGFSILKQRASETEPEADRAFTFEYKLEGDPLTYTLGPIVAGATASSPTNIKAGTKMQVRETPLLDSIGVSWEAPVWAGLPPDSVALSDGWVEFTLPSQQGGVLELTATNKAQEILTNFSVKKTVSAVGNPDVANQVYGFKYRVAPQPAGGSAPVFGAEKTFTLVAGAIWDSAQLQAGSVIEVREDPMNSTTEVSWASPVWTVDGSPATVVAGWTRFTLTGTTEVALEVQNRPTERTSFTLQKAFDGTGVSVVAGENFPIEIQTIVGGTASHVTSADLKGDGTVFTPTGTYPVGTIVKVREVTPLPVVSGIEWGPHTWTDGRGDTLTQDPHGWVSFEIGEDLANAALTVTNTPRSTLGGFAVRKTLLNPAGITGLPTTYTLEYQLGGENQTAITLSPESAATAFAGIPEGTPVSLREVDPASGTTGVNWNRAWKINGAAATPDADGWITFDIEASTQIELEVVNTASPEFGQFRVGKQLSGDGASHVPDSAVFTFRYSVDGGPMRQLTATSTTFSNVVGNLPIGAEVTISEVNFPSIPGIEFAENPRWSVNGDDEGVQASITFTITNDDRVEIAVENTATELFGSFEITKEIGGTAAVRVPDDAEFTVEYSTDGGANWIEMPDKLKKNDLDMPIQSPLFLVGTVVQVREAPPTPGPSFSWGTPNFTIGAASWGPEATFTIVPDGATSGTVLGLENPVIPINGTFAIKKAVEGDFALTDAELRGLTFTVPWTTPGGRAGTIYLNAANNWTAGPGTTFQVGAEVTLTEAAVTGLPDHAQFDGYSWLLGTPGVTVSSDGKSALLVVGAGVPEPLTLQNSFSKLTGTFMVEKSVEGAFEIDSPQITDLEFTVNYRASTGATGALELSSAGHWMSEAGVMFPTGTIVTLTEAAIDQSTLPPNVKWEGYSWLADDAYTVSADGLTATLVVGDKTKASLKLENTFSELTGSFAVAKQVTGDFDQNSPELSGLSFEVEYETDAGESGTLDLNAANGWSMAGQEFPAGTEIQFTETTPSGLPANVKWDSHRWLPAEGVTVSLDGQTAVLTVDSTLPTARLAVENRFSSLESTFSVEKVVEGEFALTDPELDGLTFSVPYTASNGDSGTLSLNAAGEWKAAPGAMLPLGTEVTLTEADVAGLPAHVQWDGYVWLEDLGYTVSPDGKAASFTLTSEDVQPKLTLQNSFSELRGGFTLQKQVTGQAADSVPDELEFVAEFSLDGGTTWIALSPLSKADPFSVGPNTIRLGTEVLIRELAPAHVAGVEWGSPAFSGAGVTPGGAGAPASFVVESTVTPIAVLLENPTTPSNGQFMITKVITGHGASLLSGNPEFTVRYTYEGQQAPPGELKFKAGEIVSSGLIPSGTQVTITEVAPVGGLVEGASWGTPVLVLEDGTVLQNGATIVMGKDEVIELQLENPTKPPLPPTGALSAGTSAVLGLILGLAGLVLLSLGMLRRSNRRRA